MLIILEGCDNSGKSTLAEFLSRRLGFPIRHSGGPAKDEHEMKARAAQFLAIREDIIFDRFPVISEPIYSAALGRKNMLPDSMMAQVLRNLDPVIIYCRPSMRILLDFRTHRVKDHEDPRHIESVKQKAVDIIRAYDSAMRQWDPICYDYTAEKRRSNIRDLLLRYINVKRKVHQ